MYAENTIYEIDVCSKGEWKTLSTFGEAGEAIAEAVRLRRSYRYAGIRVTEETFQQAGNFVSRVVYRYALETGYPSTAVASQFAGSAPIEHHADYGMAETAKAEAVPPIAIQDLVQTLAVWLGFVIVAAILALTAIRSL
jgi:hypothetical protein